MVLKVMQQVSSYDSKIRLRASKVTNGNAKCFKRKQIHLEVRNNSNKVIASFQILAIVGLDFWIIVFLIYPSHSISRQYKLNR